MHKWRISLWYLNVSDSYPFLALLLLLSHFSRVRLCVTPWTAAHQAPLSLGFSRQEHWSGCQFLLQCMKVKSESEVAQSCPTLRDPMDCSLPGSSIHGIFQARVLEWVPLPSPYIQIHNINNYVCGVSQVVLVTENPLTHASSIPE